MRPKRSFLRAAISVFLAAVFLFAAQPGTMAMPSAMTATAAHHPVRHHEKTPIDPCTNMAVCMGLLACHGLAAVTVDQPVLPQMSVFSPAHVATLASVGLTHPPEHRPPIA